MKNLVLLFTFLSTFALVAQTTYVPDDNFEDYLEIHDANGNAVPLGDPNSMGNGIANDNYVFTNRINTVTELDVRSLSISDLTGIEDFAALQILNCNNNNLSSLDVSQHTLLMILYCAGNNLSSLDVQANSFLSDLYCRDNTNLTTITFNVTTHLKELDFTNTGIASMNLSGFTALEVLNCGSTTNTVSSLSSLTLTNTPQLNTLNVLNTKITSLDISNHSNFLEFHINKNSLLTQLNLSNIVHTSPTNAFSAVAEVDNNSVLNSVNLNNANIKYLYITNNSSLTSLNLSNTVIQDTFRCGNNNLNSLQVNHLTNLVELQCQGNNLSTLQVSNLTNLTNLRCSYNNLSTLQVANLTNLNYLNCNNNNISNLYLSTNTNLTELYCNNNNLSNLDLTSISSLVELDCSHNQLTSLDVSKNTNLQLVDTFNNNLKALNLKNGNNSSLYNISAVNNPDLFCINVDNVAYANANTSWLKDITASYSTDCYVYVPDDYFEQELINLGYDDVLNDYVARVFIENVTSLNLSNKNITDLTGIEGFTSLENLNASSNSLNVVNISQNTALVTLDVSNNGLVALDVSSNTNLTELRCQSNTNISSLDVSSNPNLTTLWCYGNKIEQLNLNNNTGLTDIRCHSNLLNRMTIKNQNNSAITTFSAHTNPNLTCIEVDDPVLLTTNFSGNIDAQTSFSLNCYYDDTYIPDAVFEAYLETHDANGNIVAVGSSNSMGNGISGDNYVTTAKINTVTNLNVSNLGISDLTGIEDFTALTHLNSGDNSLSSININTNTNLIVLQLYNNNLTSIDVSALTSLEEIYVNNNSLTALDVTANSNIKKIYCYNNQITGEQLKFPTLSNILTHLLCQNNQITKLNLSYGSGALFSLSVLDCSNNSLSELYLSNYLITSLNCSNNNLSILNLKNTNNTNVTYFNSLNNPNLTCIEVDDAAYSTANWTNKDVTTSFNNDCHYDETYVPDDNFENYLETHDANGNVVTVGAANSMGNGIANDNYVFTNRIDTVTNLNVSNQTIADLTGIEDFTALQLLNCGNNSLTSLDVTQNTALTDLDCSGNSLTSLDVTQNTALISLLCQTNQLTSLDVTQNISLTGLWCYGNQLTSLDVSQNTVLTLLNTSGNQISYLDLSTNVNLIDLFCSNNQLTGLSVYYNNNLQILDCDNNQISNLILPNQSTSLQKLICDNNNIPSIDVSGYSNLTQIICNNNSLTQLNVKNGNNTNIINADFNATNNPNLTCIQVDDAAWSLANWSNIDAGAGFSANCGYNDTFVPDDNFENYLETHDANGNVVPLGDPNSMGNGVANDNFVTTAKINTVTQLDISNLSISDVTGIQDFTTLTNLNCANNSISVLDLGQNTSLAFLDCSNNNIPSLNLLGNISLQAVTCNNNNMEDLNIAPNSLAYLYCQNNSLQQLDLSQMYNLIEVVCNNNQISNLDVMNSGANLSVLLCNDNQLTGINTDANVNLIKLYCQNNAITSLNLTTNTTLEELDCSDNNLTTLDVTQNTQLGLLYCSANSLTALNVTQNTNLTELKCNVNQLSSLDVSQNTQIGALDCTGNQITQLDTSNLPLLTQLYCGSNQLTSIDVSANTNLIMLWIDGNQIETLDLSNNAYFNSLLAFDNPNLYQLDIKNGNNSNQSGSNFNISNCPLLTCVQVDDVAYSDANWTNKDPQTYYNTNCPIVTIWSGSAWSNGTPTIATNAIIRGDYNTASNSYIDAGNLVIENGVSLTVLSGYSVFVYGDITVHGSLHINPEAIVVQELNTAKTYNNGTINVNIQTPNLASRDFMILGSPMTAETRNGVFNSAFLVLNHTTANFVPNPDVAAAFPAAENFADDNYDNWNPYNGIINPGEGYIVRPQAGYGQPGGVFSMTYQQGTLNNGFVNFNVVFNNNKNDSPNVLANPYASAIYADDFINANSMIDEVYFWEHLTPPSSSLPGAGSMNFSMEDISMYNLLGGIPAASDPGTSTTPNGYISTGQGFGIKATASGVAFFENNMRRLSGNNTLRNPVDKDRIWLRVSNSQYEMQNTTLVGFTDASTQGFDNGYDSRRLATVVSLYSHLPGGDMELDIQAREAFNEDIEIPMGFSTLIDADTEYKISIADVQGANLEQAEVYLVDTLTGMVTNLNEGSYSFTSGKETYNNRFILLFKNPELSVQDYALVNVMVYPNPTSGIVTIVSPDNQIQQLHLFDLQGRQIRSKKAGGAQQFQLDLSQLDNAVYLLEIITSKGKTVQRIIKN